VRLHAPSIGWFIASVIIAMIAVVDALSPIPYITTYGIWIAILAYLVLAIANLAHLLSDSRMNSTPNQPVLDATALALVKALQRAESDISIYQAAMSDREIFSDTLRHIRLALAQAGAET
jgi:hypothetical protein